MSKAREVAALVESRWGKLTAPSVAAKQRARAVDTVVGRVAKGAVVARAPGERARGGAAMVAAEEGVAWATVQAAQAMTEAVAGQG